MLVSKATELCSLLKEKGLILATAESCTGGMLGQILTSVPGASQVYCGGIISYTNHIKEKLLSVDPETLLKYDAVSTETAIEMACGARKATNADIAVSVTGFAGPGGGTESKPVGTVCFAISSEKGSASFIKHFGEEKSRDEIRELAASFALNAVYEAAKGE